MAVLGAEMNKGLRVQLAHPLGHIITLLFSTTMFLGLQFVLGQGELRRDLLPRMLVAIAAYWFLHYSAVVMVGDLLEERRTGTYGQGQMALSPPWLLVLGRLLTASVFGLVVAAASAVVPMLVTGATIPIGWTAAIPYALTVLNILSFTVVLAAVALRNPMIGAIQSLLTMLVLLLNGSFLPLSLYPDWLAVLARFLPTTLGIDAVTKILFDRRPLGEVWSDGTLPLLIAHTLVLGALGGLLYARNQRRLLRDGGLDQA